jgi:hypothetical protein
MRFGCGGSGLCLIWRWSLVAVALAGPGMQLRTVIASISRRLSFVGGPEVASVIDLTSADRE